MRDAIIQEQDFYKNAIALYNLIDKKLPIPTDFPYPPGYDETAGSLYDVDKDKPGSREKLKAGADLHLQNRPADPGELLGYALPISSLVGDLVCLSGIQFICTEAGSPPTYYPVGIQEPKNVCSNYPVCHATCDEGGGGGGGGQ